MVFNIKISITLFYLFLILNPQYTDRPSTTNISKSKIEKDSNNQLVKVTATIMNNNKDKCLIFKTTDGKIALSFNELPTKYMHYNQGRKLTIYYIEEKNRQIYKVYYSKNEAMLETNTSNDNEKSGIEKFWSVLKYIIFFFFVYNIYSIYRVLGNDRQDITVYKVRTHPMKFNELFKFYTFKKEEAYYGDNFKLLEKNGILSISPSQSINIGFFLGGVLGLYLFSSIGTTEENFSKENTIFLLLFVISLIITIASLYFIMKEKDEYKITFDKQKKVLFLYDEKKIYFRDIFCLYQTKVMIILPSDETPYTPTYQLNVVTKKGKGYCIRLTKDSTQALNEAKQIASFINKPLFVK